MKSMILPALLTAGLFAVGAAQAETTKLTVTSFPSFDKSVKAAIPGFKKLHPEIEINLVSLAYGDHHNAMTTALASSANLPDVMAVEVNYIGKFAESGGLEDLAKAPYSAMPSCSKFSAFTCPQAISPTGALTAIPADIGPGTLFYRKDILDKASVTEADLTKSWESYIESGKKIKAATGAYLIANSKDIKDIYLRSGVPAGDGVFFDKNGKPSVDSPRFEKAFELCKAARVAGIDAKIAPWTNEWSEGFKSNKVATQMMGAWLAGHLSDWLNPEAKGNWRSAQLPGGSFGSYGGSFYSIPKQAKNKAAAWEFIKYMTLDKPQQIVAFRDLDAFPALIEAQNDPFLDKPIEFLGGQPARQLWKVAADKIVGLRVDKYDGVAMEITDAELDKVLEENKDIKQALADAKKQIEKRVRR